ncbi:4Fe-4S dicluster domain-containing protein [Geomonas propionica]|uniref:4Fe-4S binding protein n=1 Tax=Geomonas propionica TaxID=2798582 RepID=A0ABS0YNB0_9BACT|nr:4Fe-4S dicluster domain-containing protein [Geomonas propionica]MBJ6799470.1 4Fe-4S binding protein [Geomonas propionica]
MTKTREPDIDAARCTGCGRCVAACPYRLITLEVAGFRKYAVVTKRGGCDGCLACLSACPVRAIT